MVREISGNIFNSSCQTIVNTVNCVGVMGKGIAIEYKLRYPDMFDTYFKLCERKLLKPGLLQLWTKSNPWILNFPTKFHWKYPSKLEYVELGLEKFHNIYLEKKISSIAFPLLGVNSGGLDQNSVVDLMTSTVLPIALLVSFGKNSSP